jgi:hypothetical protein
VMLLRMAVPHPKAPGYAHAGMITRLRATSL